MQVSDTRVTKFTKKFPEWLQLETTVGNSVKITADYLFHYFLTSSEKIHNIDGDITMLKLKDIIGTIKQLNAKYSLLLLEEV